MVLNVLAKPHVLLLILGAIASGSVLSGCNSSVQSSAPTSTAIAQDAKQTVDSTQMAGMNHGGHQGGAMDHSAMDLGPADAEIDLRFIDSMIPHHEGAVIMAQDVLKKSQRPELRKLAEDIIKAQEKEIQQMQQWRKTWYPKAPSTPVAWHASMGHSMAMTEEQIQAMRMTMDLGAADANFDQRFIDAMIPHHEGAVVMANEIWRKSKRPELQALAKDIIGAQRAEIEQMQQWRKAWYGK